MYSGDAALSPSTLRSWDMYVLRPRASTTVSVQTFEWIVEVDRTRPGCCAR